MLFLVSELGRIVEFWESLDCLSLLNLTRHIVGMIPASICADVSWYYPINIATLSCSVGYIGCAGDRLTWEIIKQHRARTALVLTTHSMEEAEALADRIVIMAEGHLAAQGTALDLKVQHGVGYTLTISRPATHRR